MKTLGSIIGLASQQRYLIRMFPLRHYTIRQCMMAFGAALVLPSLMFAVVLLWRYASAERGRYEEEALTTAQRITAAVDRELVASRRLPRHSQPLRRCWKAISKPSSAKPR